MRRSNWLLIIVLVGVLASGAQLANKAQLEPLERQLGLAVAVEEVSDSAWWPALHAAGVRFALVTSPEEYGLLPVGILPVRLVSEANWQQWQAVSYVPPLTVFADNRFTEEMATAIKAMDYPVGLLEFKPQHNFRDDPQAWAGQLVRVYNQAAHRFIDEYTIAVRERQVDLVVVHMDETAATPLTLGHVQQVSAALAADGHQFVDQLQPRAVLPTLAWVFWLQVFALGALAAWMLVVLIGGRWHPLLLGLPCLAVVAVWLADRWLGFYQTRQLVALAAALAYPSAGLLWWWCRSQPATQPLAWKASPLGGALSDFWGLTLFSLAGGLTVHALLSHFAFHLNLLQFVGVKLAYFLPLAAAALLIIVQWLRHGLGDGLSVRNRYLRWLLLVLALLVFLLAVYVLLNRTGNQSRVRILPIELELREWLYRTFWVRPRTKEFLGYPILLVGLYLWRRRVRLLGGLGFLLGFIGQLSLLNTFEHLHHPILLSLIRSGLSLAIGVVLGLIGMFFVQLILPRREGWR